MASVRQRYPRGGPRRPADLAPGELVWARIINGLENPNAAGKSRPGILIEARGSAWRTMGLTTNPRYRDGSPRIPIPDSRSVGLRLPGWLWGNRLCWVSGIDIESHIGWVDEPLSTAVAGLAHLNGATVDKLLASACRYHERLPSTTLRQDAGGAS